MDSARFLSGTSKFVSDIPDPPGEVRFVGQTALEKQLMRGYQVFLHPKDSALLFTKFHY